MKRKVLCVFLCILLLCGTAVSASADTLPKVVDNAGLLTDSQLSALEEKAAALWDSCRLDVVIVTVNSLDGKSVQTYADDYYDDNGYGYGDDYSGILLLLAMETREWYISTCGEANYIFTDYGLDEMGQEMLPQLSSGDYSGAFDTWLELIPIYCERYDSGRPIDGYVGPDAYEPEGGDRIVHATPSQGTTFVSRILIAVVAGAVVALVVVLIMGSRMNTAKAQKYAGQYMRNGSYHLHTHRDMFLYSRVSRTRKQESSGGSRGGGSSVHRSSGGRSHGGRGGRF